MLQNVDVIMVKRQIGGEAAGAYAAAAVAAKAVVWVAIGIGLYLLPEATRAARHGRDPRPVLARALAVVAAVAVPMLIVYALIPETVLRLAFGPETVVAADALFVLGIAMTLLAVGYLGVQYMLALGRVAFLPALGVVAVAEIALLGGARHRLAAGRSPRSCSACRPRARCRCWRSGSPRPPRRGGATASSSASRTEGWLTEAQARRLFAAARRARARGRGGRDRLVPRALDGRARAAPRARSSRSTRTRAATAGRRRSPPTPRAATPTTRRSPPTSPPRASPSACATCASSPPTPTATSPARSRCCTSTARTASGPRGPISRAGAARVAPGGTMLVHDAFSSIGVTLALLTICVPATGATSGGPAAWPSTSAAASPRPPRARAPRSRELPYFARNVAIKVLVVAGRRRWAERIGLDPAAPWPY